jgi:hypothetical protein
MYSFEINIFLSVISTCLYSSPLAKVKTCQHFEQILRKTRPKNNLFTKFLAEEKFITSLAHKASTGRVSQTSCQKYYLPQFFFTCKNE